MEDFNMDIKILEVYEHNNQLRVKVRHCYGEENLGLGLHNKFIDPITEKPKWLSSVYELLKRKYCQQNKVPVPVPSEYVGQTLNSEDMKVGKITGFEKSLINILGFSKADAKTVMNSYPDPVEIRKDIMSDIDLNLPASIKEKLIKYYGGTGLGFDSDDRPEIKALKESGELDSLGRPTELMDDKRAGRKTNKKKK